MGKDWTKAGHLGLTASTGQLSDNHDVIRLETYVSSEAAEKGEEKREQRSAVELDPVGVFCFFFFIVLSSRWYGEDLRFVVCTGAVRG